MSILPTSELRVVQWEGQFSPCLKQDGPIMWVNPEALITESWQQTSPSERLASGETWKICTGKIVQGKFSLTNLSFVNGSTYKGETQFVSYLQNEQVQPHGSGIWDQESDNILIEGSFIKGTLDRTKKISFHLPDGSLYQGFVDDHNRPHGRGKLDYKGAIINGDWETGCLKVPIEETGYSQANLYEVDPAEGVYLVQGPLTWDLSAFDVSAGRIATNNKETVLYYPQTSEGQKIYRGPIDETRRPHGSGEISEPSGERWCGRFAHGVLEERLTASSYPYRSTIH